MWGVAVGSVLRINQDMEGDLAKLRGSRWVYKHHLENTVKDIKNLIQEFEFGNE